MRKIIHRSASLTDLDEIWQWYSTIDVALADRMDATIEEAIQKLAKTPGQGHRRQEVKHFK